MSDARSDACADAPALVSGVPERRWARCSSFCVATARTCGMSAVAASVISRSTTTRCTARAISASYAFELVAANVDAKHLVDHGIQSRQRRVERVLLDHPRRPSVIEQVPEGQICGDDGRRDRVEHLPGVAREELARVAVS